MLIRNFIGTKNYFEIGKYSFLAGVFFLPTALPIAGFFLIIGLFISLCLEKSIFFKDKLNLSIVIAIGLIIFSTTYNFLLQIPKTIEDSENIYLWLNIFNWIPTLLCFIAFQKYLKTRKDRLNFSKFFIAGTVPLIASCLFQLIFDISGPFETLNGLIVWFQKPLEDTGGVSGLFSNRNYTGFWLAVSLPFSLYFLKKNLEFRIKCLSSFLISGSIIYLITLTNSRNAFLGLTSSIIIFLGAKSIFLIVSLIIFLILISNILPIFNLNFAGFYPLVIERFRNIFFINSPRIIIFRSAINFILQRPFIGWGTGTFFIIYTNNENMWSPPFIYFNPQHAHNLFLEMAFNFGIPTSILITSIAIYIIVKAIPISFSTKYQNEIFNLDKAWVSGTIVVLIMHLNDVTFYDGKISILISILFSGLKCIPISRENMKTFQNNNY